MSKLFGNTNGVAATPKAMFETRYATARGNLLLIVVFTVINILLLMTGGDSYFLFSAFIPYVFAVFGMVYTGKMPEEFYGEDYADIELCDDSILYVLLGIAAVIVILYLLSWIFSKKHIGWMIFGLIFFVIDTVFMLLDGITADMILDIVFHGWVLVSLSMGITAHYKAKKLPVEADIAASPSESFNFGGEQPEQPEQPDVAPDSAVLRPADTEVKAKVFLEAESNGHKITYRRVKRVNELVIDGNVYAEMEALIESAHVLQAFVDGHLIQVGTDNTSHSFIIVDNETLARKLRLI